MRELLLNEKSLDGQFESMEAFYETLPVMSRNLKILQHSDMILQKHSSLYKRKITPDFTLFDLQNKSGKVAPDQRDKVIFFFFFLSSIVRVCFSGGIWTWWSISDKNIRMDELEHGILIRRQIVFVCWKSWK